MESFVHLRKGTTPQAPARRPGRPQRRRTRARRIHRPDRQHVPPQRPHGIPRVRPAATRRRADHRTQAQRRHRRRRRAAADVLQRRLPGLLSPAQRADAVLHPLRRRRPAVLRAQGRRPAGDRVRPAALPRGRLGLHPEGLHVAAGPRRRDHAADDPGDRRVPGPAAGTLGRHFPFDPSQAVIPEPAPIDDRRSATSTRSG